MPDLAAKGCNWTYHAFYRPETAPTIVFGHPCQFWLILTELWPNRAQLRPNVGQNMAKCWSRTLPKTWPKTAKNGQFWPSSSCHHPSRNTPVCLWSWLNVRTRPTKNIYCISSENVEPKSKNDCKFVVANLLFSIWLYNLDFHTNINTKSCSTYPYTARESDTYQHGQSRG